MCVEVGGVECICTIERPMQILLHCVSQVCTYQLIDCRSILKPRTYGRPMQILLHRCHMSVPFLLFQVDKWLSERTLEWVIPCICFHCEYGCIHAVCRVIFCNGNVCVYIHTTDRMVPVVGWLHGTLWELGHTFYYNT